MSSDVPMPYPESVTGGASKAPESSRSQSSPNVGPISPSRMVEIVTEACDLTFEKTESYDHPQTAAWNTSIINKTLQALISASSNTNPFKFAVTSTIIEHTTSSHPPPENPLADNNNNPTTPQSASDVQPPRERGKEISRRGMHSATGAYWDNAKDGCWSFKYEKGEAKGFDVVVSVIWVSVG